MKKDKRKKSLELESILEDIYIEGMGHTKGFDRKRKITITKAVEKIEQLFEELK